MQCQKSVTIAGNAGTKNHNLHLQALIKLLELFFFASCKATGVMPVALQVNVNQSLKPLFSFHHLTTDGALPAPALNTG
jgi:hypothetical protein